MSSRPRTNRSASALQRRAAVLRAATEIAGEEGAGAATHRSIAARAGVPLVTTSYFFSSLTELMAEALRTFVSDRSAEFEAVAQMAERDPSVLGAAFARSLLGGERTSELAQIEAYLHAARSDDLRTAVAEAMASFERVAEAVLRSLGARRPAEGARAFVALSDGFVLQHLANPRPDDEAVLLEALRSLFIAYAMDVDEVAEVEGRLRHRWPAGA